MVSSARLLGSSEFAPQVEQVQRATLRVTDSFSNLKLLFSILSIGLGLALNGVAAPPPPRICGTLHGPSVTAPRIRLPDGRPLSYHESGVGIRNARHKVVFVHDYGKSRLEALQWSSRQQQILEELGVYLLSYDRAGYGESHPLPHRSVESEVSDIEHLVDELGLGPKFHVLAVGIGTYAAWGCLRYIPHRLEGVAIVSPVLNFWWPGLPQQETRHSFQKLNTYQRNLLRLVHYAPQLLYWWTTQTWFQTEDLFTQEVTEVAVQQGVQESLHRDLIVQFGRVKFGPTQLQRPASSSNLSAQVWFDGDDAFFPAELQQYFKQQLPWMEFGNSSRSLDGFHQIVTKLVAPSL